MKTLWAKIHDPSAAFSGAPLSFGERGPSQLRNGKEAAEVGRMDYLEFIARVTSHIPDKGQVTVRHLGLYANAHWGKVWKGQSDKHPFIIVEKESPRIPRRGWAEMIMNFLYFLGHQT